MTTIMSGALGGRSRSSAATAAAAVWSGVDEGFSLQRQPLPRLRPGEVVVAVELATICGSDLHTIAGDRPTPVPTVLGHETVGSIVATCGAAYGHDGEMLGIGDRVAWTIGTACGDCRRCRRGIPQKCLTLRKYGHEAIDDHWRLNGGLATHCHLTSELRHRNSGVCGATRGSERRRFRRGAGLRHARPQRGCLRP